MWGTKRAVIESGYAVLFAPHKSLQIPCIFRTSRAMCIAEVSLGWSDDVIDFSLKHAHSLSSCPQHIVLRVSFKLTCDATHTE
jgi:hypothetical protein